MVRLPRRECASARKILARVVEAYRKIRNTLRYLVANLYDFDPATDRVRPERCSRSIATSSRATRESRGGSCRRTRRYDYQTISQALNTFVTMDLSAFYVDVTKDRMYTFAAAVDGAACGADGDVPHRRRA